MNSTSSMVESEKNNRTGKRIVGKREAKKMTIPRLELGISRVSGERVSHCTIQSCFGFIPAFYERSDAALDRPCNWSLISSILHITYSIFDFATANPFSNLIFCKVVCCVMSLSLVGFRLFGRDGATP